MLNLSDEDTCADFYGHYVNDGWAVVEGKGKELKDAIKQVRATVMALRAMKKRVDCAIIVAETFGNDKLSIRRRGHDLWFRIGPDGQPVYADTEKRDIVMEGWQPGEWRGRLG